MKALATAMAIMIVSVGALLPQSPTQATKTAPATRTLATKDFVQYIPYWTAEGGRHTEIHLRNNLGTGTLSITPTIRTAMGNETVLAAVEVLPGEVKVVDIPQALALANSSLAGRPNAFGSIALSYKSVSPANL